MKMLFNFIVAFFFIQEFIQMNKTYKVARSLSRGVVVTSEKASSRQGKVLKTVFVAVLSALAAASAEAVVHEHTGPLNISNTTFTVSGTDSTLRML